MRDTDGWCCYRFTLIEGLRSIMHRLNEVLMRDSQLLISPSRDNTLSLQLVHSNSVGVGIQETDIGLCRGYRLIHDFFVVSVLKLIAVIRSHSSRHQ